MFLTGTQQETTAIFHYFDQEYRDHIAMLPPRAKDVSIDLENLKYTSQTHPCLLYTSDAADE